MIPFFALDRQYKIIKDELLEATERVLAGGTLMSGPYTGALERWLQSYTGYQYAITVHSGTQALEIAARYYDPTWVLVPNLTYPATANAWLTAGYRVEIGDTDDRGILSLASIERYLDSNPHGAVCSVGLYGNGNTPDVRTRAQINIEDGAQHWLTVRNRIEGCPPVMTISFDPTKNLNASGNGGAILTSNPNLAHFATKYRDNAKPNHDVVSTNSRMSELDCAHVLVRARHIGEWQARRRQIAEYWNYQLKDIGDIRLLNDVPNHCHHKYVIYTSERDELANHLLTNGIQTKVHYNRLLSEMSAYSHCKNDINMLSPSVILSRGVLSLPMYPELTDNEVEQISTVVKSFY